MSEFFTSGLNLNQSAILKYENRPYNTVEEMNVAFIDNINKTVDKNAKLYILGNFVFGSLDEGKFAKTVRYFRDKIICDNIFLVYGNRDRRLKKNITFLNCFNHCSDYLEIESDAGRSLILSYWPLWIWNRKDSYHLYGMSTPKYKPGCACVSIDEAKKAVGEYRPLEFKEIVH